MTLTNIYAGRSSFYFAPMRAWNYVFPSKPDTVFPTLKIAGAATKSKLSEPRYLLLIVVLHIVHFCPGHGLLVSPMSPSSMRHFVAAHLVLAHLVILHFILLHLSAGRRRTASKGRCDARTSQHFPQYSDTLRHRTIHTIRTNRIIL